MDLEAIIGLEIHIQLKTKSKMFSGGKVSFNDAPNTNVDIIDLAFPGALPIVNKTAVIYGILMANALKMNIADILLFDRKNYFYSDTPKNYQITQKYHPLGKDGYLEIESQNKKKIIHLERLHLEEDSAKQVHDDNYTYIDYNRAGIPLVEIVTKPEINNGLEARLIVEKIRNTAIFLGISDGKMENGSLRCDVNISLKNKNEKDFGTKVEIKNINTLTNIEKAIEYEINRQTDILSSNNHVIKESRRYDEDNNVTISMRKKEESSDYRYFRETNIPPIKLTKEFIDSVLLNAPILPEEKKKKYLSLGLNEYDSSILINNKDISNYFDEVISYGNNPKLVANWIIVHVQEILHKENIEVKDFKISPTNLSSLLNLIEEGIISDKQARDIFKKMTKDNIDPKQLLDKDNILIEDENYLLKIIDKVIKENPQSIIDYRKGKNRVIGFLVGKVIQLTKGKAHPALTNKLVIRCLKGEYHA